MNSGSPLASRAAVSLYEKEKGEGANKFFLMKNIPLKNYITHKKLEGLQKFT